MCRNKYMLKTNSQLSPLKHPLLIKSMMLFEKTTVIYTYWEILNFIVRVKFEEGKNQNNLHLNLISQ